MENLTSVCKYHTPTPSESTLAREIKQGRKTDYTRVSWELGGASSKALSEEW
jgi:hypothetical protein